MTNTLHRYGESETFRDDYIVFAIPSRGRNDQGCEEKLRTFLRLALKYNPVNMGNAKYGALFEPSRALNPTVHWRRQDKKDFAKVIEAVDGPTTVAAVFDNREAAEKFVTEVKQADMGISVNISTSVEGAQVCCQAAGLPRHSVEYSLGFQGQLDRLPNRHVLELSTMCGHGMVSFNLAKKMIDWVREGRRTPEQACGYMARFCSCGIFNPTRARRILEDARSKMR